MHTISSPKINHKATPMSVTKNNYTHYLFQMNYITISLNASGLLVFCSGLTGISMTMCVRLMTKKFNGLRLCTGRSQLTFTCLSVMIEGNVSFQSCCFYYNVGKKKAPTEHPQHVNLVQIINLLSLAERKSHIIFVSNDCH